MNINIKHIVKLLRENCYYDFTRVLIVCEMIHCFTNFHGFNPLPAPSLSVSRFFFYSQLMVFRGHLLRRCSYTTLADPGRPSGPYDLLGG